MLWPKRRCLPVFVGLAVLFLIPGAFYPQDQNEVVDAAAPLQTFTVTTDNGSGAGSLRQAITDANASPGLDMIVFNIPGGGVHTQFATTTFPTISDPVIIDATTQPGYAGTPLVQLDDSGGSNRAFNVTANGVTIKGIDFIGFGGGSTNAAILLSSNGNTIAACTFGFGGTVRSANAIQVNGSNNNIGGSTAADRNYFAQTNNVLISGGVTNNRVSGNWFGVDTTGQPVTLRSSYAVRIDSSPGNFVGGSVGTTPGGSCTGQCNVIARTSGVVIAGAAATGNRVLGNFIGLLADGLTVANNSLQGIYLNGAPNNFVGGTTPAERNVIVGNGQAGVLIEGAASTGNIISGNYLGIKTNGVGTASNSGYGVQMRASSASTRIGGTTAGERNIISGGIFMATNGNTVLGNYIGTDATGLIRGTTQGAGILMSGSNNTIGGTAGTTLGGPCTGACNLVSGNGNDGLSSGIDIEGGSGNVIDGNYIGLNAAGTAVILNGITPNGSTFQGDAILLNNASNNTIGRLASALPFGKPGSINSPSTLICVQDDKTGDYISYSSDSGSYEAVHCASGRTLTGYGEIRTINSPFLESLYGDASTPGFVRSHRTGEFGNAFLIFPDPELQVSIDDSHLSDSTCSCPTKDVQVVVGTVELTGQGGDSNNNYIGRMFFNALANGDPLTAALDILFPKPPILNSFGNGNVIENPTINSINQPNVKIQNGINNSVLGDFIRIPSTGKPIDIAVGANGNLQPPTVQVSREVKFLEYARVHGTVTGPPNTQMRVHLYGLSFLSIGDFSEALRTDLGLTIDVTTDASGQATFDQSYGDASAPIFQYSAISATVSVLIQTPFPAATSAPNAFVLGNTSEMSLPVNVPKPVFDFDRDGRTEFAVYRHGATSNAQSFWYSLNSFDSTISVTPFGIGEDQVMTGDHNGDQVADFRVYRPSNNTWYSSRITGTPSTSFDSIRWGQAGDVPVVGDFDGDGRVDPAVYRGGTWWIYQSLSGHPLAVQFGVPTDKPVPADYNGDQQTDIAVYRNGVWYISVCPTCAVQYASFGLSTDIPVPGDFDGDGKADVAVWRPSNGVWYLLQSTAGFAAYQWGTNGDVPINGDFDGDGKNDVSIWRPSTGDFWILQSSNSQVRGVHWGQSGDIPVAKFQNAVVP